jgi:hypothetical protein
VPVLQLDTMVARVDTDGYYQFQVAFDEEENYDIPRLLGHQPEKTCPGILLAAAATVAENKGECDQEPSEHKEQNHRVECLEVLDEVDALIAKIGNIARIIFQILLQILPSLYILFHLAEVPELWLGFNFLIVRGPEIAGAIVPKVDVSQKLLWNNVDVDDVDDLSEELLSVARQVEIHPWQV